MESDGHMKGSGELDRPEECVREREHVLRRAIAEIKSLEEARRYRGRTNLRCLGTYRSWAARSRPVAETSDVTAFSPVDHPNAGRRPAESIARTRTRPFPCISDSGFVNGPSRGQRHIAAMRNPRLPDFGAAAMNMLQVKVHALPLARHLGHRPSRTHDATVQSRPRTCAPAETLWGFLLLERQLFFRQHRIMQECDWQIIARRSVTNAWVSAANIGDMMQEATERRLRSFRVLHVVEYLSNDGLRYTAIGETLCFDPQLTLIFSFTAVLSPAGSGMYEAFDNERKNETFRAISTPNAKFAIHRFATSYEH